MTTIEVQGQTFPVTVAPDAGFTFVDVYDGGEEPVATVVVRQDGPAEWEWRTESYLYANRPNRWWNDLLEAAASAVIS